MYVLYKHLSEFSHLKAKKKHTNLRFMSEEKEWLIFPPFFFLSDDADHDSKSTFSICMYIRLYVGMYV